MADEMIILTRTFDLLDWLLPKLDRFLRTLSPDSHPAHDGRGVGFSRNVV